MSTLATKQYVDEKASGGGGGSGLQYFKERSISISKGSPFGSGSSDQLMGTITMGSSYIPSTYNNLYLRFECEVYLEVYRNGSEGKNYGHVTMRPSISGDAYSTIGDFTLPVNMYWPASSGSTSSYPIRNKTTFNNLVKLSSNDVANLQTNGIKFYASKNMLSTPETSNTMYIEGKVHILYD